MEPPPLSSENCEHVLLISRAGRGISGGTLGRGQPGRAGRSRLGPTLSLAAPAGAAAFWQLSPRARGPAWPGWPSSWQTTERFQKAQSIQSRCGSHFDALAGPGDDARAGPAGLMAGPGDHLARRAGRLSRARAAIELDWFADCQARERSASVEALRHYRYRWVAKPSGSLRLIEAPKPRLKQLQRRLLDEILLHIPPHDAAHGFRPGRSVPSFVAPHVGRTIVLKMDLRDFFVSITAPGCWPFI